MPPRVPPPPSEPPQPREAPFVHDGKPLEIPIEQVERNPDQPRVHFDHAQLEDLISSIKEHGILQPLVVSRLANGRYQLIAGERRLRSATIAGLKTVPVVVRDANANQRLEWAIIENVQRQDLNPIEEARAYVRLMEEFGLTQDEVSHRVGKSRPQVGNMVRLLQLPGDIQQALIERRISASHARTLLSLPSDEERYKLFQAMLAGNFTVREAEAKVNVGRKRKSFDPNTAALEDRLRHALHCKVEAKRNTDGSGEIKLKVSSEEEMNALVEKLSGGSL
jgi:ParB family chromosome partitioning protein